MDALVCCNPIHVDDEQIDMDLEDVWELQRQRSKGGRASSSQRKGRINFLRGNKNRRGFSLTRKNTKASAPTPKTNSRRSLSRGRGSDRYADEDGDRERQSRSPWGRRKDKKVSMNKYVEKIETAPKRPGSLSSRGRSAERASSGGRSANSSRGIGRQRTRSWSLGRRKTNNDTKIIRVRSRSKDRVDRRQDQSSGYADTFRRGFFGGGEREQERSRPTEYGDAPRRGLFGGMGRGRRQREEESWSSSEESYDGGGGFFSGFR